MDELPPPPSNIGKRRTAKHKDGSYFHFTVIDEVSIFQSELPTKAIYLQRLQFEDGRIELRLGYYIIGKLPRSAGKWVWGQFATMLPTEDFIKIVQLAQAKGWLAC